MEGGCYCGALRFKTEGDALFQGQQVFFDGQTAANLFIGVFKTANVITLPAM